MTHQKNSGAADNGPPSLFGEVPAEDTPGKTISILSAVTGKEVPKSSGRKKALLHGLTPLLLLLTTGVLGFTFWQYSGSSLESKFATPVSTSLPTTVAKPSTPPVPLSTVASMQPTSKPANHADVAVIETLKPTPALASVDQPPPSLKKPESGNSRNSTARAAKAVARPRLASARVSPAKGKVAVKKVAETPRNAKAAEKISKPQVAEKTSNPKFAKTAITQASSAKPEPSAQKKVSGARAASDPDEKLLEGMLRLMKRDNTKDTTNMSSAK